MKLRQLLIKVGLSLHKGGVFLIIEDLNGLIRIVSEGENKITNKKRDFYSDFVYLGKNDSVDNYEEVPYEIWGLFLDEIPKNKVEELTNKIKELEKEKAALEDKLNAVETEHGDYLMDNDLRITKLELGLA